MNRVRIDTICGDNIKEKLNKRGSVSKYYVENIHLISYRGNLILVNLTESRCECIGSNIFGPSNLLDYIKENGSLSLKDYLNKYNLGMVLCNSDGNCPESVVINKLYEISNLVNKINKLQSSEYERLVKICNNTTNHVTDLIGINVHDNPASQLDLPNQKDVIIKATRALKFQINLSGMILADLLLHGSSNLINESDGRDRNISRSLKSANIKITDEIRQNEFKLQLNYNGEIIINGANIIENGNAKQLKRISI